MNFNSPVPAAAEIIYTKCALESIGFSSYAQYSIDMHTAEYFN